MLLPMRRLAVLAFAPLLAGCGGALAQSSDVSLTDFSSPCLPLPACVEPGPPAVEEASWRHTSSNLVALGAANHRGRDQLVVVGEPQWILGKFAYGLVDKDLKDEDVAIFVHRGCSGTWEALGTATTSKDGDHPAVLGVEDSGGRVYFEIPEARRLEVGRHRVRLVVKGDLTWTDLFLQVVEPTTALFVSDVDGTLTTSEFKEFEELLEGEVTEAHHAAPEALGLLARRGYLPVYLTARPEWLTERTREFLRERGFPPGVIHTTTSLTGALGGAAAAFKESELAALAGQGFVPRWAFGNKPSDGDAYAKAGIAPLSNRVFYRMNDVHGGRRIEDYAELLAELAATPSCL
jgi:hypothetical protein